LRPVPPHIRQGGGLSKNGPVLTGRAPATAPVPRQAWHVSSFCSLMRPIELSRQPSRHAFTVYETAAA